MLTYRCNASCKNCGTFSHPKVSERLEIDRIISGISQASCLNFGNVVFTGGEATLYFSDLILAIEHASNLEMHTRLVTNGIWALKRNKALEYIERLIASGLDELNFSMGDEHARFIPTEAVFTGLEIALQKGLRCHVMIENVKSTSFTEDFVANDSRCAPYISSGQLSVTASPWMPLEPLEKGKYDVGLTANSANLNRFGGCNSVLQTYVLSPDNFVSSCCGLGVRKIPSLHSLADFQAEDETSLNAIIAEAEEDFLKMWLRVEGPEHILAWAASHDPTIDWENRYAHRCQACIRMYSDEKVAKVMHEKYHEKLPDIIAKYALQSSLSGEVGGSTEDQNLNQNSFLTDGFRL